MRLPTKTLTASAAALSVWIAAEGFSPSPYIPTKGDVPTIGHGSTRYEDGTRVRLTDPPITQERARELASNLFQGDCKAMSRTIPEVLLTQEEYDLYCDFVGQYGIGNWNKSSMKRLLFQGNYGASCKALLAWRKQAGRDCSDPKNWGPRGCKGVWTRQQERYAKCMAAQ